MGASSACESWVFLHLKKLVLRRPIGVLFEGWPGAKLRLSLFLDEQEAGSQISSPPIPCRSRTKRRGEGVAWVDVESHILTSVVSSVPAAMHVPCMLTLARRTRQGGSCMWQLGTGGGTEGQFRIPLSISSSSFTLLSRGIRTELRRRLPT